MREQAARWCVEVAGARACRPLADAAPLVVFNAIEAVRLTQVPFVLSRWSPFLPARPRADRFSSLPRLSSHAVTGGRLSWSWSRSFQAVCRLGGCDVWSSPGVWATAIAQLLPRLLAGRTSGPVFLADRRPGLRAYAQPPTSVPPSAAAACPTPAEFLFKTAFAELDSHGRRLHPAPPAPQRADPPGRRRLHRTETAGQVPPPAPGQPRPLRPRG
jgi:hypothetical protein